MIAVWGVFFTLLWQVLSNLCWKPLLALIEAREAATVGASNKVKLLNEQAEEIARSFENEILKARITAAQSKAAVVQQAKTQGQAQISSAEQNTSLANKKAGEEIQTQAAQIEQQLHGEISQLAEQALIKMGI